MRKITLTIGLLIGMLGASFAQVIYTENYDKSVDNSGYYYWSWYNQSNTTISNLTKASSGELQITLASAGGSGQDNNAIYFTLYGSSSDTLIDMTSQKIVKVKMKSSVATTVRLDIRSGSGDTRTTDKNPVTQSLAGDGNYHTLTFDFSNKFWDWQDNKVDSTQIHSFVFNFNRDVDPAVSGTVTFDQFQIGQVVASTAKAAETIASSSLYPNPSTGFANLDLTLKESANVKVTLTNSLGEQVYVIADKTTNTLNESFDVSRFAKGMYNVTYYVNGVPAKSELLMVK